MLVGDGSHPLDKQFRAGAPFGIPLYFHIFLLLFMGLYLLQALLKLNVLYVALPVVLVLSVYLHELGHALTSAYFGKRPRRIVLHLFGGVAEVPHGLSTREELFVIAGGPLVSLALAITGFALMPVFKGINATLYMSAYWVFQLNAILFVFNVLPIYPLDGGQFLRSWLTLKKGRNEGIRRSLPLSMATLIVMGILALALEWIGIFGLVIAMALGVVNYTEYQRHQHLFSRGFWAYIWPFGGPSKASSSSRNDMWPGEKDDQAVASQRGGLADQMYVWWNQKRAEKLMRKADEVGIFNLSPKDRALLERYLDAKIGIKERKHNRN